MSTSDLESLRGSCSCGRNQYFIHIPDDVADHARIYFDDSSDNRTTIPTRVKFLFFFFFFFFAYSALGGFMLIAYLIVYRQISRNSTDRMAPRSFGLVPIPHSILLL